MEVKVFYSMTFYDEDESQQCFSFCSIELIDFVMRFTLTKNKFKFFNVYERFVETNFFNL